jgi:hypothetical protein
VHRRRRDNTGVVRIAAPAVAATAIAATGYASGGYFPLVWGWCALALLLATAAALIRADRLELSRLELIALGALGALASWSALSATWSASVGRSVMEGQRGLVYVAALSALLLLAGPRDGAALAAAAFAGAGALSLAALSTRLFPGLVHVDVGTGRLSWPIGYWNALGLLSTMATLIATAAATSRRRRYAATAAAIVPPLVAVIYLTFSRGSWVALAVGAAVLVAAHPLRARAAVTVLVLAAASAVAVWIGSRMPGLWNPVSRPDAANAGHRFAAVLALVALASMFTPIVADRLSPEWRLRLPRRAFVVATVAAGIGVVVLVVEFAPRAYDSFQTPAATTGTDLNDRLFSASGQARADYWRVAWHDVVEHPLLGSGGGTYDLRWDLERPNAFGARDAHNLYLETLAELGPIGLLLLGILVVTPLATTLRPQLGAVGSGATAAYAAYLVDAAVDWDWEIPTVTLTALTCAAALLVAARGAGAGAGAGYRLSPTVRTAALIGVTIAATIAIVGYVSADALRTSREALSAGDYSGAVRDARRAARFAPWASEPWLLRGEAELAAGDRTAARASFRRAITKDRADWLPWFRLASASVGPERAYALEQALRRNPNSPEAAELRRR